MAEPDDICTLRVLHLPPSLSDKDREELFQRYGAVKTRTIRRSPKYTITFVEFPSNEHATEVFLRLHQLPIHGRRLSIEFAKRNISADNTESTVIDNEEAKKETELKQNKANFQEFIKKLNTWLPHDALFQPIPPNLKYNYPAPTKTTLLRIAIQLKKEPAFYTQVLHLMNKMCLPAPFEELEEEFPMLKEYYDVENYRDLFDITVEPKATEASKEPEEQPQNEQVAQTEEAVQANEDDDEEEESEIESDGEVAPGPQPIIPEKRKRQQPKRPVKIPKYVNPLKQPSAPSHSGQKLKPEDMFELPSSVKRKTIVVKPPVEEKVPFVVQPSGSAEGFGLIFPAKKEDKEEPEEKQKFITTEQLENKITTNDQRLLPVFQNYHPGKPSTRLYIKNLSKQVEENDLHFIYRRYVLPSSSGTESEYNVRLMQEGRMKGQAFITLPNIAQAQLALNETNGYILKDKPMVVQFAKVPKH